MPVALAPRPVSRWRWWVHFLLIVGYFIPAIFLHQAQRRPALTNTAYGLVIVSCVDFLLFVAIFFVAISFSRANADDLYLRWRPGWWVVPLGIAYSIAMRIAAAIVMIPVVILIMVIVALTSGDPRQFMAAHQPNFGHILNPTVLSSNSAYYWLTLTLISFVSAGVREELWRVGSLAGLRALFPAAFASVKGQIAAIALLAVLFGAGHFGLGFMSAIGAGILGFFLGVIIVSHRSVWPAVFAHGFLDAATFAALPFLLKHLPHT